MKKLINYISLFLFTFLIFNNLYGQYSEKSNGEMRSVGSSAETFFMAQDGEALHEGSSSWQFSDFDFKLKTNVAYLAATVVNIGVELKAGRQLSVDIPFLYSPYNLSSTKKIRVLAFQPEVRYWLQQQYGGHFVGAHMHLGWFNTAGIFGNDDKRYQDSDNKPLWGVGVSYGYAISLSGSLGLELTLGLGYARISYDTYYNIDNGSMIDSGIKKSYWGITRVGVSLSYKL